MERKIDKRTVQTKKKIKDVLIEQLKTRSISDISVTEISELCDINRNTFYIHYSSIKEVLKDIEDDIINQIIDALNRHAIIDYIKNPQLFTAIIARILITSKNSGAIVFEGTFSKYLLTQIISAITQYVTKEYKKLLNRQDDSYYFMVEFLVAGFVFTLKDWYNVKRDVPLEEILARLEYLVKHGMSASINNILSIKK